MTTNPFDWVTSISETKEDLTSQDPRKNYNPYIVNKALSHQLDCLLLCNEMNFRHFLDKDIQYSFLFNSIRKRKRPRFWVKKLNIDNLDTIKSYFGYNNDKAQQALEVLTKDQITYIMKTSQTGEI